MAAVNERPDSKTWEEWPAPGQPVAPDPTRVLQGPTEVTIRVPEFTRGQLYSFSGTLTGNIAIPSNGLVLVPNDGRFNVRGIRLSLVVTTTLHATSHGLLGLYADDGTTAGLVSTIAPHADHQQASSVLAYNMDVNLGQGWTGERVLYLAGTQDLGAGEIAAHGDVLGSFPPKYA